MEVRLPALMYGIGAWKWRMKDESKINAVERRSRRHVCKKLQKMQGRCKFNE